MHLSLREIPCVSLIFSPPFMRNTSPRIASRIFKAALLLFSLPRIAALRTILPSSSPHAPQDPYASNFRFLSPSPLWLGFSFLSLSLSVRPSRGDGAVAITRNACLLTASAEIVSFACAYAQALSLKRSIKVRGSWLDGVWLRVGLQGLRGLCRLWLRVGSEELFVMISGSIEGGLGGWEVGF
jgi:hypothetical protein